MIYFNCDNLRVPPRVHYLSSANMVVADTNVDYYLDKDAKFLFNINDVANDAVKERQASPDAESLVEKLAAMPTPIVREPAGLVSVAEMQEFVDYAEPLRFCNSGTHVCDTLLDRFEKVLAQIKEDER